MNFKNLKIVKSLKNAAPRLKWLMFSKLQDYKINSKYVDLLIGDAPNSMKNDEEKLESMVIESLVKEFSPEIKKLKSFNLIVDGVVHNLKRKQMGLVNDIEE